MGRTCATCGRERPHEAFGGKGEWARICRDCRRMPIWCHRDASSRAHSKVALFGTKTRWHFCWRQSSVVLRRSASRSCGDICWYQNSVSRKYQHVPTIFRLRAAKQRRHFFLASGRSMAWNSLYWYLLITHLLKGRHSLRRASGDTPQRNYLNPAAERMMGCRGGRHPGGRFRMWRSTVRQGTAPTPGAGAD